MMNTNTNNISRNSVPSFNTAKLIILAFFALLLFAIGVASHARAGNSFNVFGTSYTDTTVLKASLISSE